MSVLHIVKTGPGPTEVVGGTGHSNYIIYNIRFTVKCIYMLIITLPERKTQKAPSKRPVASALAGPVNP
jgi:hypothetical protein